MNPQIKGSNYWILFTVVTGTLTGVALMSLYDMRMEKNSDRRWRQRIRRDVLTSRAPTQPYKCAECPRHFLFRNFPKREFSSERLVQRYPTLALLISLARVFPRV